MLFNFGFASFYLENGACFLIAGAKFQRENENGLERMQGRRKMKERKMEKRREGKEITLKNRGDQNQTRRVDIHCKMFNVSNQSVL